MHDTAARRVDGKLIWITGLAGSGKTTLARGVYTAIKSSAPNTVHLDGDSMREVLMNSYSRTFGHTIEDRKATAYIYSKLAAMLTAQGIHVVVSTISLFHEIHDYNRGHNTHYYEILVEANEEERRRRTEGKNAKNPNHKDLYDRNDDVMGVHQEPEFPRSPTLVITNDAPAHIEESILAILRACKMTDGENLS
jgi:adenylylsulfate kinase